MKVSVSLPDELCAAVNFLAHQLGVSRSALIADVLAEFIETHPTVSIVARLDAVYADDDRRTPDGFARAQRQLLERTEW